MAEKKKTTSKKATTPKKVAAKATSTAKKKTVAKKTTAKKTVKKVTPKKVVKKTTTKSKTTKPKAPSVMEAIVPSVLTFEDWKKTAGGALTSFKSIWWRMALINIASIILFLCAGVVSFVVLLLMGGGSLTSLENEFANFVAGTPDLLFMWGMGIAAIVLMTLFFMIGFLINISLLLTYKKYHLGKENNPLVSLFKDAWGYLGRYAWMAGRLFIYIMWIPILLGVVAAFAGGMLSSIDTDSAVLISLGILAFIVLVALLVFVIWRSINVAFSYVSLIHGDKAASPSFHNSLALVKGNWWTVLWGLALFFVPISFIQNILALDDSSFYEETAELAISVTDMVMAGFGFFLSVFVFAPLSVAFIYRLMLHLSERKNIKI